MSEAVLEKVETAPAPVKGGVVAYLQVDGALAAAEFYTRALGAEVVGGQPPDERGRTMHVHLYINDGSVMLCDPYPEHGFASAAPQAFILTLQVDDADAWWTRAIEAGCTSVVEVEDMFWGDRYGQVRDPYGVVWAFNQPLG